MNRVDPWGLLDNVLKYKNARGSKQEDNPWYIFWELEKKSEIGGWIVQEVIMDTPGGTPKHYWEAWKVKKCSDQPIIYYPGYSDMFIVNYLESLNVDVTITAVARFYEGLKLPDTFKPENPYTKAGLLPSTEIDPNLPIDKATAPVERTWTAHPPIPKKSKK